VRLFEEERMKKRTVTITIKFEPDGRPGSTSSGASRTKPDSYGIAIRPSKPGQNATVEELLAHELGHIVGNILKTEANVNDPRTGGGNEGLQQAYEFLGGMPEKYKQALLASEEDAWRIAELIVPGLEAPAKEYALDTYRRIKTFESFSK
jgi:hypothetical protein